MLLMCPASQVLARKLAPLSTWHALACMQAICSLLVGYLFVTFFAGLGFAALRAAKPCPSGRPTTFGLSQNQLVYAASTSHWHGGRKWDKL